MRARDKKEGKKRKGRKMGKREGGLEAAFLFFSFKVFAQEQIQSCFEMENATLL